ncbi:hypothetical protein [Roseibium aggregatum]|uniref:hypothetical protein n=1 Tax=Roseibium aggregatum TaxID=187304 RepID=UPI00094AFDA5|nr:hypothetical protein [Roseibium aggregatum]UFI06859.1 hypothetical protein ST40_029605 [Roseibium aggregatum]
MHPTLRNFLLSAVLIAIPVTGFVAAEKYLLPSAPTSTAQINTQQGLGDLSAYQVIVADTQKIADTGDLKAAEQRITDLETLWDQNATDLRKADAGAWTTVDAAADEAFSALRSGKPEISAVKQALANLSQTLQAPVAAATAQPVQKIAGIVVTDETGRALPCEVLIGKLRDTLANSQPSASVADLQSRALERCNADDDAHANAFTAQALAQLKG